jgi:type I restriction enzyme S subunit
MDNQASFIKYSDIAEFRNGLNFSKDSHGKGCLMIGVADFKDNFAPKWSELEEINPLGVAKDDDYLQEGDIIFVRSNGNKALVGRSLYIDRDVRSLYSGFCIRARTISDKIDPLFIAYFSKTDFFKSSISSAAGTNINNLNQGILGEVRIPNYSKSVQSSIIAVLSAIDKKIELNNRINAELEAMAKTLYDYWFVQFDFPNDSAQGQGKPYKTSGGKMVYNPTLKREIPEGWEVLSIGDYADVKKGTLITEKDANQHGNIKVVSAGLNYSYLHDKANYQANVITISASGASAGFINFWREPIFACDCTVVKGRSDEETIYLLNFLKMRQEFIYQQARGSAQPHVYPKDISGLYIEVPPSELLKTFGANVLTGNTEISNRLQQNEKLAQLRDWLLPMLMNGQVTVTGATQPTTKEA